MKKIKFILCGIITAFLFVFVLLLNVRAAEVATYTYANNNEVMNIEIVDDTKCIITVNKNNDSISAETTYTDTEKGFYIPLLETEFEIGVANTLMVVESTPAEATTDEKAEFELNEETLNKLLDVIGKFNNGEYSEAIKELKITLGVAGTIFIILTLLCISFVIKYFKKSTLYKQLQANLDAEVAKKLDEHITATETKINNLIDIKTKQLENADKDRQAQIKAAVNAVNTKLASIKLED